MRNRTLFEERAKKLVAQMTVEEKASQLRYDAPPINRLGIPAYNWWNEALHGVARAGTATSFPQAIGLAAMFDEELLGRIAHAIADEGRAKYNENSKHSDRDIYKGLTFWSPNVNIFRDPRWGRGHETYGEDPYLSAALGKAFVKGLQGDKEYLKAAACAKHFAVHSGPENLRHEFDAEVSKKDLYETYLPAFEALVKEAEVESVMGAYNRTNGEPCCGSYTLLRDILRKDWGFKGHVVSDCWAIRDFHEHHHVTATAPESAALALKAGCDLNCGNTYQQLLVALENGLITEDDITLACERLFTTRFMLGLFDKTEFDKIPYEVVDCKEHAMLNEQAARESAVLLRNNGVLPLDKNRLKTVAVIGPNADSRLALMGNYYGTASRYITVLEGVEDYCGDDVRVLYAKGCELKNDRTEGLAQKRDRIAEAISAAEHSDAVILCLGLDETLEGEEGDDGNGYASGDKNDLLLPAVQRELLETVTSVGKPVILCLTAGSAIDLSFAEENCAAILQLWYPGARGGKAAAELLFGECSPSGKLPVTFYRNTESLPPFTDYSMKGRTYRYIETEPLYPFGYGLSYGDVSCTKASAEYRNGGITITAEFVNNGAACTEKAQVYIKDLKSRYAVPNFSLCGFKKIELGSGEKCTVEITANEKALTVVDDEGNRYIDSDRFTLYVGTSAPDSRSVQLTGKKPIEIELSI